ncbi:hypothetical protein [Caballeronia sp. LZ032]|uniref:hypothetical protein n=1 Tax=Caballeronia sp. LZ032 TaxID=3038565 RepID=UPI0028666C8A|nr:hypothetical protein [Caballeronia sp. LZ032]MDR5879646.1 hypothetical protein [Caballeronia sp. LZ032]
MGKEFGTIEARNGLHLDEQIDASSLGQESSMRGWELGEYQELYNDLVEFMGSVLSNPHIPYEIRHRCGVKYAVASRPTLTRHLRRCHAFMDLHWPSRYFSADLKLFFECYRAAPIWRSTGDAACNHPNTVYPDGTILAERFNAFVAYMREQARARCVAKKLSDWRRGLDHQEASIGEYLDNLHFDQPDIIAMRADFSFVKTVAVESDAIPRMSWQTDEEGRWTQVPSKEPSSGAGWETSARIDPTLALQFRESFFDNQNGVDRELFEHLVGYISKVEQGAEHGAYHVHILLLLDAKRVKAKTFDRIRGIAADRWRRLTNGLGNVFDCHHPVYEAKLRREGRWSLDPVLDSDPARFERLRTYIIRYFAKDDGQMVRVKPFAKSKMLTKGRNG